MRINICVILLLFSAMPLASAQRAREIQRINTTGSNPSSSNANNGYGVASHGETFLVVWAEQFGTTDATEDIYASVSHDGGFTWSTPARVDVGDPMNSTDSNRPHAAILEDPLNPGSLIYICTWEDSRLEATPTGNGAGDDYFAGWSTDGSTWNLAATLVGSGQGVMNTKPGTYGAANSSDVDEEQLWASDGILHAVWEEDGVDGSASPCSGGPESVFYSRSIDGGRSWSLPLRLNNLLDPAGCLHNDIDNPFVHADGNLVAVVWCDDILSIQSGTSANDDIWINISPDGGLNWLGARAIEDPLGLEDLGDVDDSFVYVDGFNIAVYYQDNETSGFDVPSILISPDAGTNWSIEQTVSPGTQNVSGAGSTFLDCCITGSSIYYVFCSDYEASVFGQTPNNAGSSSSRQLYMSYSHDLGVNWTYDVSLDPNRPNQECAIAAEGDKVFVAAQIKPYGQNDLAYWVSLDGGRNFTYHPVASTANFDVDQTNVRNARHFAASFDLMTGCSVLRYNMTGMNETYVAGIRTPGLEVGSPMPGMEDLRISGVVDPGTTSLFVLLFSAQGNSPAFTLGGQILNLVLDPSFFWTVNVLNGSVNSRGFGVTFSYPALANPLGVQCAALILNAATGAIQISDPIAL